MMPFEHPSRNAKQAWIFKTEEDRTGKMNLGLASMVSKDIALNKLLEKAKIKRSQGLKCGDFQPFFSRSKGY